MAQRRPSSATSLSHFAHQQDPPAEQAGLDFCNAFWGPNDAGYDVLLARMRGAGRTMEELRAFWKERAALENEYASKLAKLAKYQLGRDEIGELRTSLDTLKLETEKQAVSHQELAGKMRQELELPVASFITRQVSHKKTVQASIEKAFKNKQAQETHVAKSRERYESDCLKINSCIAGQNLAQGKELERLRLKLERAQATIGNNEKDYASFTRALADTTRKWEQQWKEFCDTCQDLEDDRIDFMKDNVWSYANALSSVCVSDDESCEQIRISLEQLEVDRDMENFISAYSTGSIIPDPPKFIDFRAGAPGDSSAGRRGREARFARESKKVGGPLYGTTPIEDYEQDDRAGSGASRSATPLNAHPALPPQHQPPPFSQVNSQQVPANSGNFAAPYAAHPSQQGGREQTMLNVGGTAYAVDPNADPQRHDRSRQSSISNSMATAATASTATVATPGASNDPLAQAMNQLRQDSIRRGTPTRKDTVGSVNSPMSAATTASVYSNPTGPGAPPKSSALPPMPPQPINYDVISESIIGGPPPGSVSSHSPPNGAPMAKFMQEPQRPSNNVPVEDVLRNYAQSFPGERSPSRPGSSMSRNSTQHVAQAPSYSNNLQRPVSPARDGFAGIGAQGRSPSPGYGQQPQRVVSPYNRSVSPGQHMPRTDSPAAMSGRGRSPQPPSHGSGMPMGRPVSPAGVYGIELDASGKVARDSLAEEYERKRREEEERRRREEEERIRRQREEEDRIRQAKEDEERRRREEEERRRREEDDMRRQQKLAEQARLADQARVQQQQQQQPQQQQQAAYGQPPGRPGYGTFAPGQLPGQPPYQPNVPPSQSYPMQNGGMQQPPPQATYQPVQPGPQPGYGTPSPQPQGQGPPVAAYGQPQAGQYQQPARTQSYDNYYAQQQQQPPPPNQQMMQQPPAQDMAVSAQGGRPPPPTGQWTSTGEGILFYVKALYDYQSQIEEEFDFTTGDIIAVTATPEDGWWSGELLDEARRQKGKHIFPSNFVCLF